jgi:tetratricopeptide (TPR) repeat protein
MKERLGQVIGAARRLSGGAYARWQDRLDRKDVTGLVALSRSSDALAFSASLVDALARDLFADGQLPAGLAYLRAATDRYPQDAWLHYDLSMYCSRSQPAEPQETLRHIAAACTLRPDSALFHFRLGECYSALGAYDLAIQACSKAIALYPNSCFTYECMGRALAKKKDEKGAIAAFEQASRLAPNEPLAIRLHATGLVEVGRPAEAVRELVDALGRSPSWADDPRLWLRYALACAAMNCADGQGSPPASMAQRQAFRKQALDLLSADLAAIAKLAASDREFVHLTLRHWLADGGLKSVRPPRTADLPADERRGWEELWARVKSLNDSIASPERHRSP